MRSELLTRTECTAMRGIAIMAIMLHNYCHWLDGIVRENEYLWKVNNVNRLWYCLQHPTDLLPVHLFSFFGHYGVPVFLFLSGFGLVMKYEGEGAGSVSIWRFVRYNYLKLLRILIVGFVAFVIVDAITPNTHRYEWLHVVGVLGMFANLLEHPAQVIWPGPYWYFGLTLQLYIVYRLLFARCRHWSVVAVLILGCWLWQEAYTHDAVMLERLRYNCVGGMLPFGLGILVARYQSALTGFRQQPLLWMAILLLSIVLVFAMSFQLQAWFWIPVLIVVGTIALVKVLPRAVLQPCVWLGGISAAIFVSHPILRKVFIRPYGHGDIYAGLLLYIVTAIAVAWLFMQIVNRIPKPKLK